MQLLEGDVTGFDPWDFFSDFNMYGVCIQLHTPATSPVQKEPPIDSGWEVYSQSGDGGEETNPYPCLDL